MPQFSLNSLNGPDVFGYLRLRQSELRQHSANNEAYIG
jgi:hypothetical protein